MTFSDTQHLTISRKVIDCGNPLIVEDLDTLPFPDYSDFSEDIKKGLYSQPGRLDILDSRGCVNACYFCYEKLYWQKYRTLTGKRIYEQICYYMDKFPQINYFYFNGLLLNANLKVLNNCCDLVIKNRLKINWAGQAMIHPDMTKEVLIKVRPYIDSVLASQSFCTLEKETYMWKHPGEFGITGEEHHLFWKSNNGVNNYQKRFVRYERFCQLALKLGIPETSGVLSIKPDKWLLLGKYYQHEKRYKDAIECFKKSLKTELKNQTTYQLLNECYKELRKVNKKV